MMPKKVNEKSKKKNQKEKNLFEIDNEIIIGIKPLPEPNITKKKKEKTSGKKKGTPAKTTKNATPKKQSKTNKKDKSYDEIELSLGIEDETIKKKDLKKKNTKKRNTKKRTISPKQTKTPKQQEIARKKRKIIFRIIKWTTLLAIMIGGLIYFMLSPFFNIKTITTSGNEKITKEELISLSGIELEQNTFKISNSKVVQAIKENAYVESVKISRKLPDGIEIQITERKPTYMIAFANAYIYLNNQGYLLEVSKTALEVPVITGFLTEQEELHAGNRLCSEDLQRLNSVIQIMDSANNNELGKLVNKINMSDKQDFVLELKSEKKNVHMGDTSNLSTKMLFIKSIIQENKGVEGDIFVNTDLSNKGAIFREKV